MLTDSVERMMEAGHAHADIGSGGFATPSRVMWKALSEQGVLALPFPELEGGLGMGMGEVAAIARILGRQLSTEPYLSTVVLGGGVLRSVADENLRNELIPPIIDGRLKVALAFAEPESRYNLAHLATTASPKAGGFVLNGRKSVVLGAEDAEELFITARSSGDTLDEDGHSLFRLRAGVHGLTTRPFTTIDGRSAADLQLDEVFVPERDVIGAIGKAYPVVQRVVDEAIIAVCAEAVGAMEQLCDQTLDYCRTRHAFGKSISSFQVVQHRLVDMRVALEHAQAIVESTAREFDKKPKRRALAASAAKAVVAREGDFIGKSAIQLHGAIGITEDLPIGRFFKRLISINALFGGADHHERRYYTLYHGRTSEAA